MPGMKKRLDSEEEKTDILEDTAIETNSNKTKRKKRWTEINIASTCCRTSLSYRKGKKENLCQPSKYLAKIAFKNIDVQS